MNAQQLKPLDSMQGGCLCCPPKPNVLPLDAQPHPGFGSLNLTRDGETPEWWDEFCDVSWEAYWKDEGWRTTTVIAGPKKGETVEWFDGDWHWCWAVEEVTLAEIEECVAEDPDHDWRLRIYGAMSEYTYQRQGCAQWVGVEKGMGFA